MKRIIVLLCVVCISALITVPTPAIYGDVTEPEEGFNALKAIAFFPAAIIQVIGYDLPRGLGSLFSPNKLKIDRYEKALRTSDWTTRYHAVTQMALKRNSEFYPLLVKALSDSHTLVSLRAFSALSHADKKTVVPLLLKNLDSRDPWTRKITLDLLAKLNDTAAIQQMVFLANDDYRSVMLSAVLALEELSGEALLSRYYPSGASSRPRDNIINWWYTQGKVIEKTQ